MTFESWMHQALFAPERGYYSGRVKTVGRRGDFSTIASTSPLLAKAIAEWLKKQTGDARAIIEVGGGDGTLMHQVRNALGWWERRKFHWHMVEISPPLQKLQRERLGSAVQWHEQMADALEGCGGYALIYHNELVDAFPVRLLQWSSEVAAWQEVHVEKSDQHWREVLQLADPTATSSAALKHWQATHPPPQARQRIELHESYQRWLQAWAPLWKSGAMLTIDYGEAFPDIYHRRPAGTLRAYLHHQTLTGPDLYLNMGRQDITSDVNFTDLMTWGDELGWSHDPLLTQRDFLLSQVPSSAASRHAATAFVLDENGAGGAFRALVQRPGTETI